MTTPEIKAAADALVEKFRPYAYTPWNEVKGFSYDAQTINATHCAITHLELENETFEKLHDNGEIDGVPNKYYYNESILTELRSRV